MAGMLVSLVTSCSGDTENEKGREPLLAFIARDTIEVTNAGGNHKVLFRFKRFERMDDGGIYPTQLTWSADRESLAWYADGKVYLSTVATSGLRTWTCSCDSLAFLRNDLVTISSKEGQLTFYSADGSKKTVKLKGHRLPEGMVSIMAANHKDIVFLVKEQPDSAAYGGPVDIFTAHSDGAVRYVRKAGWNTVPGVARFDPKGEKIAFKITVHNGACGNYDHVSILDATDWTTPISDLPSLSNPWYLISYSWGADGKLYASTTRTPECDFDTLEMSRGKTKGEIRVLEGNRWKLLPHEVLAYLPGSKGVYAELRGEAEYDNTGVGDPLGDVHLIDRDGTDHMIAVGVSDLLFAPD